MAKDKKYAETKTQRKQSQVVNGIGGGALGAWAGGVTAEQGYRKPEYHQRHRWQSNGRMFGGDYVPYGDPVKVREGGFAQRAQESAKRKTSPRPNPNFNTKRWEKISNLHERAGTAGEQAAAGAAKERMLSGGQGPTIKGSRNLLLRAMAHKHSPKVTAAAAGLAVAIPTGAAAYSVGRAMDKHITHPQANRIEAERKHNMSKSAFGVDHEEVSKKWDPSTKTRTENVGHGAGKGAAIGAGAGGAAGAAYGARNGAVWHGLLQSKGGGGKKFKAGEIAALYGATTAAGALGGGVNGAATGTVIGAGHGALRRHKELSKAMDLKPLVYDDSGHIVGNYIGHGQQRDPKSGPFGVPKGPLIQTKPRLKSNTIDASTDLKPSGVQGRGKGKRDPQQGGIRGNTVSKAFDPMTDEELDEVLKGMMGGVKAAGAAVRGFTQYHGAGMANKAIGMGQAAKPKIGAGLKLAAANPGKTAAVTAGVGGGAGFGIGRKTR